MSVTVVVSRYDGKDTVAINHQEGVDFNVMYNKDGPTGPLVVTNDKGRKIAIYNTWDSAVIV